MKKLFVLFSSLLLILGLQIPIYANAKVFNKIQAQTKDSSWKKRKKMIEKAMIEAYTKRNDNDVIQKLQKLGVEYLGSTVETSPINYNTSTNNFITPLSYGSNVTLSLSYYWDRFSAWPEN
ncbi:hypothetical protein ACQYAD_10310 [Neobacillus sp. SM06]|uniref:hypothetical protein n=1 Tax=Neobacillus sp. SM06 TaxID=3422492 RepID=UPI003D2B9DF8